MCNQNFRLKDEHEAIHFILDMGGVFPIGCSLLTGAYCVPHSLTHICLDLQIMVKNASNEYVIQVSVLLMWSHNGLIDSAPNPDKILAACTYVWEHQLLS